MLLLSEMWLQLTVEAIQLGSTGESHGRGLAGTQLFWSPETSGAGFNQEILPLQNNPLRNRYSQPGLSPIECSIESFWDIPVEKLGSSSKGTGNGDVEY